jgi:inosine/xanthosine triphosphate pyrophosphatase family protein
MPKEQRKIVLASRNEDKIREMRELCAELPFTVQSALDYPGLPEVIEDGTTPLGNASRKAIVTAAFTGEIAVADDTTLQVPTLNDLPDVFAARFAGPDATYDDNARLLLELLENVDDPFREARFETAVSWVDPRPGGHGADAEPILRPARVRWLANPFARSIEVGESAQESEFWNRFSDRRAIWDAYRTRLRAYLQPHGADRERVLALVDELVAPYLGGGRPAGYPDDAIQLPDTRLWTIGGPDSDERPPTHVAPAGLATDAPGRGVNEPSWLEITAEGRLLGTITRQPFGSAGFGYDPVFRPAEDDRTLAELPAEEKNEISHRGRALRRLVKAIGQGYGVRV